MITETNNTKNCRTCNKSNVCKYSDRALDQTEKLIDEVSKWELPLSITINCREWADRKTSTLRQKRRNIHIGLTCKPVGKMRSITRKLENQLTEEAKLQKEKKEMKKNSKNN